MALGGNGRVNRPARLPTRTDLGLGWQTGHDLRANRQSVEKGLRGVDGAGHGPDGSMDLRYGRY